MGGDAQFFTRTNTENTSLPTGCSQEREVWLALMGLPPAKKSGTITGSDYGCCKKVSVVDFMLRISNGNPDAYEHLFVLNLVCCCEFFFVFRRR